MLIARKRKLYAFAVMALVLVALVVVTAGCGGSTTTGTTAELTTPTAASSTSSSSSAAGSTTTIPPATTQSQSGGAQSLTDLINKYKQVQTSSLDFTVTTPDGKTASGMIWGEKSKMLKIETTAGGIQSVILINYTDNTMTVYQPSTNRGTKTKAIVPFQNPQDFLNGVDLSKVKDLGTTTLNGETCRVFQYPRTSATGTTTDKMWLSERLGFPIQETSTTAAGKTTTIDYTNIKAGPLPSDTFTVPASVKITTAP